MESSIFNNDDASSITKKARRKTFIAWKVVNLRRDGGLRPLHGTFDYTYKPGVNHAFTNSDRRVYRTKEKWTGRYDMEYPSGIHVYINKADAERCYSHGTTSTKVMFPVTCHVDDLVRADWVQAVLRKATILRKDWDEAMNDKKKVTT